MGDGSVRRLLLNYGQVDDAFRGIEAEGVEDVSEDQRGNTFIDLYGRCHHPHCGSLYFLGDSQYESIKVN